MIESPKDFAARIYGMMAGSSGGAGASSGSGSAAAVEPEVL